VRGPLEFLATDHVEPIEEIDRAVPRHIPELHEALVRLRIGVKDLLGDLVALFTTATEESSVMPKRSEPRILGAFELAESTDDEAERARQMTFVLVGAGPTGASLDRRTLDPSADPGDR
jgi:hypothetical protein